MTYVNSILKAVTAALITGLGTLQIAYQDNHVTNQEWVSVAISTLVALGGVWAVPNAVTAAKTALARPSQPPTSPGA